MLTPTERKLLTLTLALAAFRGQGRSGRHQVRPLIAATRAADYWPQKILGRLIGERRDAELRQYHQSGSRNPRTTDPLAFWRLYSA